MINGVAEGDNSGMCVRGAGDINNDGYADMLVGAIDAAPDGRPEAGQVYVIFGGLGVGTGGVIEPALFDGTNGFLIDGPEAGAEIGYCAGVGDVNNDSVADVAIGNDGPAFVIFGGTGIGLGGHFDLTSLDGTSGFMAAPNGDSGVTRPSSRIDVNHDGIDDLVFGVPAGASHPSRNAVHVCFGRKGLGTGGTFDINALNGTNGFTAAPFRLSGTGWSVNAVGDVNADGVEDLLIGSWAHNTNSYITQAGRFDVLFGRARFGDFDRDKDVDLRDFRDFALCFNGADRPPAAQCPPGVNADFDADGDVDTADFAIFGQRFTGSR